MSGVTDLRKRYMGHLPRTSQRVFQCAACGGLADSTRRHAITCSPACRVRLHRHPEIMRDWVERAEQIGVCIPYMLEINAAAELLPDFGERVFADQWLRVTDLRREIFAAYWRLLMQSIGGTA